MRPYRALRTGEPHGLGLLRVHERVAWSALGSTHLGWLVRPGQLVSVLHVHPHLALANERVEGEVRLAKRVQHPNVIGVLGCVRRGDDHLVVLEHVPGPTIGELLAATAGPLPPRVATAIAVGMLRGVHAAHHARRAPIRREISPSSVVVCDDGRARVVDFDVPHATRGYAVAELLPYAAPERLIDASGHEDPRGDVWAASVLLWEMLTGRGLFRAGTVEGTVRAVLAGDVPETGGGPAIDAIVRRGLMRNPEHRFASARAMAVELERLACAVPDEIIAMIEALGSAPGVDPDPRDREASRRMRSAHLHRREVADNVRRREEKRGERERRRELHIECSTRCPKM